jgi:hypothetical protein
MPVVKRKRSWKKIVLWVIGILVVLFAVMQAVPYGRSHANPPVTNAFKWSDPQAEALATKACYDCHSNQTDWWWASNIAPFSWLIQADVNGGRERFNFSEYAGAPSLDEFQEAVQGGMPPFQYTIAHPGSKLNAAEKQTLIKGYGDSLAANGGASSSGGEGSSTVTTVAGDATAVAVINQACGSCHSAAPALSFHAGTAAQARALMDDMIKRGATLTVEQQKLLLTYYTR